MIPVLLAVLAAVSAMPESVTVLAAAADSVPAVAPWQPPSPPRRPGERLPPGEHANFAFGSRPGSELAPDLSLADAWMLRAGLRDSHQQRVHASGAIHESRDLSVVPSGVLAGKRESRNMPPPPRHTWAEIDSIEARSLVPSPLDGTSEVLGYLAIIPMGIAGAVAAASTEGDDAAKEQAAGEAAGVALGVTIAAAITTEAVGELFLRPPGRWVTVYRRPALRRVETSRSAARDSLWRILLAVEGQRRVRVTLADGVHEVNSVAPTVDGLRLQRFHRRRMEAPREIGLADVRRLEILAAPGMGGPPPRPGRDVAGSVVGLGLVAGAALTADDGDEFGQNLIGSAIVGAAGAIGLALLWLVPYHVLSHWETIHVAP